MNESNSYTIGRLAKEAGVSIQTIRFYERRRLIDQPRRSGSAYRQYDRDHLVRIRFIKRAQDLGFSLNEIKQLLELNENPRTTCAQVKDQADRKLVEIEAKIRDLQRMRRALTDLSSACMVGRQAMSNCRVIECVQEQYAANTQNPIKKGGRQ